MQSPRCSANTSEGAITPSENGSLKGILEVHQHLLGTGGTLHSVAHLCAVN